MSPFNTQKQLLFFSAQRYVFPLYLIAVSVLLVSAVSSGTAYLGHGTNLTCYIGDDALPANAFEHHYGFFLSAHSFHFICLLPHLPFQSFISEYALNFIRKQCKADSTWNLLTVSMISLLQNYTFPLPQKAYIPLPHFGHMLFLFIVEQWYSGAICPQNNVWYSLGCRVGWVFPI